MLGKASAVLWRGFSLAAIGSLNMWRGVVPGSEQVGCPQVRLLGGLGSEWAPTARAAGEKRVVRDGDEVGVTAGMRRAPGLSHGSTERIPPASGEAGWKGSGWSGRTLYAIRRHKRASCA